MVCGNDTPMTDTDPPASTFGPAQERLHER